MATISPAPARRAGGPFSVSSRRHEPGSAGSVVANRVVTGDLIQFNGDTVVAIPGAAKPRQADESAAAM